MSTKYRAGYWPLIEDPRAASKRAAIDLVPADAPASVAYQLAPHMSHRAKIYEWPVPWKGRNWGIKGENLHDPADVEWLAVDRQVISAEDRDLLSRLLSSEYTVRSEREGIVVAQRARAP